MTEILFVAVVVVSIEMFEQVNILFLISERMHICVAHIKYALEQMNFMFVTNRVIHHQIYRVNFYKFLLKDDLQSSNTNA